MSQSPIESGLFEILDDDEKGTQKVRSLNPL